MRITTTTQSDGKTDVKIEGELRIGSVTEAKQQFLAALADCSDIRIDLGELQQCDTAGIQFLLMTCASARAKNKGCVTIGRSAVLLVALDRAGIAAELIALQPDCAGR